MAINWDMYADSGRNVASGLGSLMDLGGISAKAKNRAALDQKFSSLAALGSPDTGAMTGLPLRAERDRQPTGPAPEQFAGNPQPAQQFDGPMGGFSNKDLIEIIRNPEASDGERAMVLDEYKRRTTPKDPYAERMKALDLQLAEQKVKSFGQPEIKSPVVQEFYNEQTGQKEKRQFNFQTGGWDKIGVAAPDKRETPASFDQEAKLRSEVQGQQIYKDANAIQVSYQKMQEALNDTSPAGDISLVYGYMKMLDPTSVVREGEFATAENAAGVPIQIQNLYNKIIEGERLPPSVRADFGRKGAQMANVQIQRINQEIERYRALATQYGLNPDNIGRTWQMFQPPELPKPPQPAGATSSGIPFQVLD